MITIEGYGDVYSNLIGYIDQILCIEKRVHHPSFSVGVAYWWFNPSVSTITATQDDFRPEDFLGDNHWILIAKTYNGILTADENVLAKYNWPEEDLK